MGLGPGPFPIQEVFWGARRYLEALAVRRPLVVVVEDAHHAQTTFLDLLDEVLASTAKQASLLLLVTARPVIADARPAWGEAGGTGNVELLPLDRDDTGRLVESLLGGPVQAVGEGAIASAAEGNPLFVAQLVSLFLENGLVERRDEAWKATGTSMRSSSPLPSRPSSPHASTTSRRKSGRSWSRRRSSGCPFPRPPSRRSCPRSASRVAQALDVLDRKQFINQIGTRPARTGHSGSGTS